MASHILNLGTIWRRVVRFTPQQLYPWGKSPRYLLDRRLGGPHNRSGRGDEQKKNSATVGSRIPIVQLVAWPLY